MFALEQNNYIRNGVFMEIGSHHPTRISNTYALQKLGWTGVLIDKDWKWLFPTWIMRGRRARFKRADATKIDWVRALSDFGLIAGRIDYLSIDVDRDSLACLRRFPFHLVNCNAVTVEHDSYRFGKEVAHEMRSVMKNAGYKAYQLDVKCGECPFEDWWIPESR